MTLTQHFLSSCHYFAAVLFAFVFLFRVAFVCSFGSVSFYVENYSEKRRQVYLPAFFTIIFSPSSRSDSFYLLSFFQNQLRDIIARRCAMRFPAKKYLLSPTPRVHANYFPLPGKSVRTDVRYIITKFSGMDSLPNFLTHGAPLRARFARAGAPLITTRSNRMKFRLVILNIIFLFVKKWKDRSILLYDKCMPFGFA